MNTFLQKALANFVRAASGSIQDRPLTGVLCVVDASQEGGFERLSRWARKSERGNLEGGFCSRGTTEDTSLDFRLGEDRRLVIVAGRQIESRERLEVLAIGTRRHFESGARADQLIRAITGAGGLPVVPWGVGKWVGTRGELVEKLLQDSSLPRFFLGDSAHRPSFWPRPSCFRRAEKDGIWDLPGSDPLPFKGEVGRVGSFGFMLTGSLDTEEPVRSLKKRLSGMSTPVRPFGSRVTVPRFLWNQALMWYRTRIHS